MKWYIFFILCILAFVSPEDAVAGHKRLRSNSAKSFPASTLETPSSHWTVSTSREKVPTGYPRPTQTGYNAMGSPTRNQKTDPSRTTVPKSMGKVSSSYSSHSAMGSPTSSSHATDPKSREKVPTGYPTTRSKSSVSSTMRTTSQQNTKSPISRGSYPTSAESPKSSSPPATTTSKLKSTIPKSSSPPTTTNTNLNLTTTLKSPSPLATTITNSNLTTTQSSISPKLTSPSKTLTVSNGQTVSAQVGWMVVGVGIGGSVAVGGNVLPVAGGAAGIIVGSGSGQDEIDTTSTSTTSKTSSSSSSPSASPTPYNIYPRFGSTSPQQSAFARDLERIAQPGSVRSIIGVRNKLLLWVASLTPAQASELSRNPVVSPTWCYVF